MNLPRNSCQWGIGLANSFRNTSKALLKVESGPFKFKGYGTNLQNPSDRICQLYIPDDGKIFVQGDQAGADARIVAWCLKPGNKLRLLYENGIKPHTYIALHLFADYWSALAGSNCINHLLTMDIGALRYDPDWPKISELIKTDKDPKTGFELRYFLGKKSVHSFNYKKQPQTYIFDILKETEGKVVLPLKEGQRIYDTYHGLVPELRELFREQEYLLRQTRELRNLFNFPRKFFGAFTDKFFREAISFIFQSTVASITNIAFVEMQRAIEQGELDWDLLNQKHDSILLQCPEGQEEVAGRILKSALEIDLVNPWGEKFAMKAEVGCGYNWRKADDKLNPNGMREMKI